ncbi:MAG: prephenate dehydrogenase [Acidobacteriales bacterium]|nr:prephenate dehydrogenase [Terriglobales bacterium]
MAETIQSVAILGTGLIGTSIGLALRAQGFTGSITGWDKSPAEAEIARDRRAIDTVAQDPITAARLADCIILAMPVFGILDWIGKLAPILCEGQLVTDVGSTKQAVCARAAEFAPGFQHACFLPGHPMAGKEVHGATHADADLFKGAVWLFTEGFDAVPIQDLAHRRAKEWRQWVERFGCRTLDLDPAQHDKVCAWASHLPQMVGTALAALLEDTFPENSSANATPAEETSESSASQLRAIGGRAMHEMTRLGASPYSMWRDIAQTNEEPIAEALLALEQRLAQIRENLKQPDLRDQFQNANRFRSRF